MKYKNSTGPTMYSAQLITDMHTDGLTPWNLASLSPYSSCS
jgi:hypothetical protein